MVSHRHTNGNGIYLPAASTSAKLLTAILEVEVPESQKQSVSDAFQNVVLPPSAAPTFSKVARRELAGAKLRKKTRFEIMEKKKIQNDSLLCVLVPSYLQVDLYIFSYVLTHLPSVSSNTISFLKFMAYGNYFLSKTLFFAQNVAQLRNFV